MSLASDLREALAQEAPTLHYQPKIDLQTENVIGFEALSRWQHPTLGAISPTEFVPIAQECDLIVELGRWTLRVAIRQLAEWRSLGLVATETTVAVDLSARQFSDPDLIEHVVRKLTLYDLPPSCLSLEVTERILITDQDDALRILSQLKSLGIGLELDDFGTGYSSMSYLHQFPFDSLKVDRSFVTHMTNGTGTATITRSIVALGKALGLKVIAEGIEEEEQLRMLHEIGCDYGQGYLISRPLSADAMAEFIAKRNLVLSNPWYHPGLYSITGIMKVSPRKESTRVRTGTPEIAGRIGCWYTGGEHSRRCKAQHGVQSPVPFPYNDSRDLQPAVLPGE